MSQNTWGQEKKLKEEMSLMASTTMQKLEVELDSQKKLMLLREEEAKGLREELGKLKGREEILIKQLKGKDEDADKFVDERQKSKFLGFGDSFFRG
jgi:hypothetical protein